MEPLSLPSQLTTDRLALRPWTRADVASLHAALSESVAHLRPWIPWATPSAPTLQETRTLLDGWVLQRDVGENFIYAIFESAGGRLVGGIGVYARVGPGRLEIGYWLRRTAAGLGYATEATRALTLAGFDLDGIEGLEIHTAPDNRASMRIPEKLGYRRTAARGTGEGREGEPLETVVFVLEHADGVPQLRRSG